MDTPSLLIENRTFDEIAVGDSATLTRTLAQSDIDLFAVVSGDVNPASVEPAYADAGELHHVIAHEMWAGTLISAALGTELPGPGTRYVSQELRFQQTLAIGDIVTVIVTAAEKRAATGVVVFDCACTDQRGHAIVSGRAEVIAPTVKVRRPRMALIDVQLRRHDGYRHLLDRCIGLSPLPTAVVHPCDAPSLMGAIDAVRAGLIEPILVGPERKIRGVADAAGLDLAGLRIVTTPHSQASAEAGVALVRAGEASALMKGSLHTDELMGAVVAGATGLRTARRISHAYVMDVPSYPRPLIITDAAINIRPSLEDKRDICQNAIDLAHALGDAEPRVAILAAVETVSGKLPSTLDAAALCKMADRGQITGALLDGPLAFDNAVDPQAARTKGIVSPVAGQASILLVPDLEAGNMLAKQLSFMAGADAAGLVLGARVPIILTSRADSGRTRMASCALAVILADVQRRTAGEAGLTA